MIECTFKVDNQLIEISYQSYQGVADQILSDRENYDSLWKEV